MKKSFLVLSALLTLFVCGFCLQSCTSEYDEYTTEEYGYYTEEEIAKIRQLIEMYDLNITLDTDYYGEKLSIKDIEADFRALASLKGEYEMITKKDHNGNITFQNKRNDSFLTRSSTQEVEHQKHSKSSWSGSKSTDEYDGPTNSNRVTYEFKVDIKWDTSKQFAHEQLKGEFSVSSDGRNSDSMIPDELSESASLTCNFSGQSNITFSGSLEESYGITRRTYSVTGGIIHNYNENGCRGSFSIDI